VLIALWANLHASFVLGLAIGALAGADLAWRSAPGPRRIVALALVASVAATLLTPSGSAIWTSAGGHFLSPPRIVLEEGVPDVTQSYGVIFVTIILAVLGTAVLSRPVALRDAAVLVPVLFVSLTAARHTPFFAVAATPYLAEHGPMALGEIARMLRVRPRLPALKTAVPALGVDLATGVVVVAALFAGTGLAHAEPQLDAYPAGALASLPSGPGLLNDYDWGGFLIWYAPATPVFIDGRLFPYTGEALRDYETVVDLGPTWRDVLARRGVRALLVKPGAPVAVRARDLGWQIVSEGERFVLFAVPNLR
jgi:hypothetical protein